jgi:NitT/TauT family transport system substrate-binding protein
MEDTMKLKIHAAVLAAAVLVSPMLTSASRAEISELRMATQFGIGTLPMTIVEKKQLLEKHLAAAGLGSTKVTWRQFPGGNPMNEGLLSGSLDIVSAGSTVFITLWAKAKGTPLSVRGIGAVSALPLELLTRNPNVKSIADLGENDRIAVTTLKVSVHAIMLQMAAEKLWGPSGPDRINKLTVQIPHGDAASAMISQAGEINNHFTAPPFQEMELRNKHIRKISSAQDILGGPSTYMVAYATEKFKADNPKTYKAFVEALQEAQELTKKEPAEMAKLYLDASKDKITVEETVELIKNPGSTFTLTPQHVQPFAVFMAKAGIIKTAPATWQEMFFPEAAATPGS